MVRCRWYWVVLLLLWTKCHRLMTQDVTDQDTLTSSFWKFVGVEFSNVALSARDSIVDADSPANVDQDREGTITHHHIRCEETLRHQTGSTCGFGDDQST
jgi:hypothetical protein